METGSRARFTTDAKTEAVLRVLKGESLESVSRDLGITTGRLERWKSSFVAAGTAELARRNSESSKNWAAKHSLPIQQLVLLLLALAAIIGVTIVLVTRAQE